GGNSVLVSEFSWAVVLSKEKIPNPGTGAFPFSFTKSSISAEIFMLGKFNLFSPKTKGSPKGALLLICSVLSEGDTHAEHEINSCLWEIIRIGSIHIAIVDIFLIKNIVQQKLKLKFCFSERQRILCIEIRSQICVQFQRFGSSIVEVLFPNILAGEADRKPRCGLILKPYIRQNGG